MVSLVVVLLGSPGVGKTTLWEAMCVANSSDTAMPWGATGA